MRTSAAAAATVVGLLGAGAVARAWSFQGPELVGALLGLVCAWNLYSGRVNRLLLLNDVRALPLWTMSVPARAFFGATGILMAVTTLAISVGILFVYPFGMALRVFAFAAVISVVLVVLLALAPWRNVVGHYAIVGLLVVATALAVAVR